MGGGGPAHPQPFQEGDECGGATGELAQVAALSIAHRRRAGDATRGKVLHESEKIWQVLSLNALFIEGEDKCPRCSVDKVVGVLDTLGDALEGQQIAEAIAGDECR
jgi:hypothetical protein